MSSHSNYRGYRPKLSSAPHTSSPPSSRTRSHDQHQVNGSHQSQQGIDTATPYSSHRPIENPSVYQGGPLQTDCSDASNTSTRLQLTGQFSFDRFASLQEYQHVKERSRVSIERDLRGILTDIGYEPVEIDAAVKELDNKDAVWNFKDQRHICDSHMHRRPSEPLSSSGSSGNEDSEYRSGCRVSADLL